MDVVLKGLSFGLILAVLIGPVFFTLIQASIEKGPWSGVFVAIGISLSDIMYICVAYLGLASFFSNAAYKSYAAQFGGVVMILFGVFSLFKKPKKINPKGDLTSGNFLKYMLKGFVVNGVSPFVLIFWLGAVGIASAEYGFSGNTLFLFFAVVVGTVFFSDLLKVYLAGKLRSLVTPRFLKIMNVVVGIALILFGGRLMFYTF